jgi:hypothetical protein
MTFLSRRKTWLNLRLKSLLWLQCGEWIPLGRTEQRPETISEAILQLRVHEAIN